jgi:transposase
MDMMGPRQKREPKLFYCGLNLEDRIPADHPLRKIAAVVDFDFVRPLVKPLYGWNGHRSIDPVVVLKLMLLLFYENVPSERALLGQLGVRLDWLWFCGYDLDDDLPDHSVLSKARRRWGKAVFEKFFQRILGQCIEAGLVDGTVVHLDSSMIDGNASKDKLRVYLRGVSGQVYDQLEDGAGVGREEPKEPQGSEADGVSPAMRSTMEPESLASPEPSDGPVEAEGTLRPGQRFTPVDPDARLGRKYGTTTLGYKDHRVVDDRSGVITATVTTGANVNDDKMLSTVIEEHESNTESPVGVAAADKAYGTGENYRYLKENNVMPCISHSAKNCNRDSDLSNRKFTYDQTTDTFLCPGGQRLKRKQVKKEKNAVVYQAPREVCENCIHFSRCVSSQTGGRRINRNLNEPYIRWAEGCLSLWQRKRLMGRRKAKIEGSFADAANNHGFKRARWRGLVGVSVQNLLIAAVQNLRKLLRTTLGKGGKSPANGILKSISVSFSSVGISVGGIGGNCLVRTAGPTDFSVFVENATATDNILGSIFELA